MDQLKPLSYESLKTVIKYMDDNFRFFRSHQITSLRNIYKVMPLRLGVLELNDSNFTFDNIEYTYKHCRKYIRDGGQVTVLDLGYDINNDGEDEIFQDLMPGDIVIKKRYWQVPLQNLNFIDGSYVTCDFRTGLNHQYQHRVSHYGMKLRDMMRKRLHELLGGKGIHQVEHLKIGVHHGVLRLPEGLKLKIRELSIEDNKMVVINAILPILDVSSFPLKSLSIVLANPQDPVIHSEVLRSSESLNIKNMRLFNDRWANLLFNLPNMKIHLEKQIDSSDILLIIRNWIERPRVVGRRLSLHPESVKKCLNEIEKEFEAIRVVLPERKCILAFPCITLPMTSTSELNIYGAKSPNREEGLNFESWNPYMIVMEVMPFGTAKPQQYQ